MSDPNILLIEYCNFRDFPIGGQLSFAIQMMKAFGNRLALVGITTERDEPVGEWIEKKIDGIKYRFFAIDKKIDIQRKPIIPARLTAFIKVQLYKKKILTIGAESVFIMAPEILIAVKNWGWKSICYRFAGIENPLERPRYRWGKLFAKFFDHSLFKALQKVDVIIASADDRAINRLLERSKGRLSNGKVIKFPTRVDTNLFKPISKTEARKVLGLKDTELIIVWCGRLNRMKGWELALDSFNIFIQSNEAGHLIFVGDGEDRNVIERKIVQYNLSGKVTITGFQPTEKVVYYLNAADLVIVTSYQEGWSIAMLEALACGKALVSTDVSGAYDMIEEGKNGFIVKERNPEKFAEAMALSLKLKNPSEVSLRIAQKFALKNLAQDLESIWTVLKQSK